MELIPQIQQLLANQVDHQKSDDLKSLIDEQNKVLDIISNSVQELQNKKLKLEEENSHLRATNDRLSRENHALDVDVDALTKSKLDMELEVYSLKEKLSARKLSYEKFVTSHQARIDKLNREANDIEYLLEKNKSELLDVNKEAEQIRIDLANRIVKADRRDEELTMRERGSSIRDNLLEL